MRYDRGRGRDPGLGALAAWVVVAAACGDGAAGDDGDTWTDGAVPVVDAPPTATCGDGATGPGESCDGGERDCAELGGSWSAGVAPCRADCAGWDSAECTRIDPARFEVVKPALRDPRWQGARCNDGTPFGFAVRLAPAASHVWMIYLQGGVFCEDHAFDCAARDPRLTTESPLADRSLGPGQWDGLASASEAINPDFAAANQVVAFYCSSDLWSGATIERRPSRGDPAQGWYFSGRANVDAMLAILGDRYGLDDRRDELRVLFGGGSAGAFGAHVNGARAAAALPRAAAAGRLLLLVDAGWLTDYDDPDHRLGAATSSDRDVWTRAGAYWAGGPEATCAAAVSDPADCWFGPGWYPHLSAALPVLVQQSLIDSSFMGVHGIGAGDVAAIAAWRAEVELSLAPVIWLFAGDQPYHTLGLAPEGLAFGPDGETFGEALGSFWAGEAPRRIVFRATGTEPPAVGARWRGGRAGGRPRTPRRRATGSDRPRQYRRINPSCSTNASSAPSPVRNWPSMPIGLSSSSSAASSW
jgi:hypothetical protein